MSDLRTADVVIIGAGMAGIYSAYTMRERGFTVRVIEAGSGVGGTWYWNRYPGARCDIESFDYSFSFSAELQNEWDWSERYATQPELERYFNYVTDRFSLRELMDFDTRVLGATFDEETHLWTLETTKVQYRARFVILATGPLTVPHRPNFAGLEDFEGRVFHSAEWPDEKINFTGRRVGLIGTGSTGIQMTPLIAEEADALYVFQRTPNYSVPAQNYSVTPEKLAEVRENYPERRRLARQSRAGFPPRTPPLSAKSALEVTPEQRKEVYDQMWEQGGGLAFRVAFADLHTSKEANETAAEYIREKIRATVKDPETAELLVPTDHPYAMKRPPVDIGYYETFNKDNVTLVDVRKDPIITITKNGLATEQTEYEFDDLILATGFDAITGAAEKINLRGVNGAKLAEVWSEGPKTFRGVSVAGFPNMFLVNGPGTPAAFTNIALHTETNVEWLTDLLNYARDNGVTWVEAKLQEQEKWTEEVRVLANKTLYPTANSWFMGANIPGKPRVFMVYVGGLDRYLELGREVAEAGYKEFEMRTDGSKEII